MALRNPTPASFCFPFPRSISQCIFHRFNQPYGPRYSWDFRALCTAPGQEYAAFQLPLPSASPAPGDFAQRIIFNVCGTVAAPIIAPYQDPPTVNNVNMTLPQPHSHGTAIQVLDDPLSFENSFYCPDTDTCDQATNPDCIPGTLNYLANRSGTNQYTGLPIEHNPAMEVRCSQPDPPAACFVSSTKCTGNIELLSYYNGDAPVFSLYDEGSAGGVTTTSPLNGVNLTYTPSLAFSDDRFACTSKDPRTGEPVVRTVNLYIACNPGGRVTDPLNVLGYTEEGQCQYYIQSSHILGCGALGDPYDPTAYPSLAPYPTCAPASAAAFNLNTEQLVGTTVGSVAALTVLVQTLAALIIFCCCAPAATRDASLDACYARCGCARGGGSGVVLRALRTPTREDFADGHGKTQILPGSAGMFVGRALGSGGASDRFAPNPLGIVNNNAGARAGSAVEL